MNKTLCQICFRYGSINKKDIDEKLKHFHSELLDFDEFQHPTLSYCPWCEHMLRKFYNFRQKCKRALATLKLYRASRLNLLSIPRKPPDIALCTKESCQKVYNYNYESKKWKHKNKTPDTSQTNNACDLNIDNELIHYDTENDDIANEIDNSPPDAETQNLTDNYDTVNKFTNDASIDFTNVEILEDIDDEEKTEVLKFMKTKDLTDYDTVNKFTNDASIDFTNIEILEDIDDEEKTEVLKFMKTKDLTDYDTVNKTMNDVLDATLASAVHYIDFTNIEVLDDVDDEDKTEVLKFIKILSGNNKQSETVDTIDDNDKSTKQCSFNVNSSNINERRMLLKNRIVNEFVQGCYDNIGMDKERFVEIFDKLDPFKITQCGLLEHNQDIIPRSKIRTFLKYLLWKFQPRYTDNDTQNQMTSVRQKKTKDITTLKYVGDAPSSSGPLKLPHDAKGIFKDLQVLDNLDDAEKSEVYKFINKIHAVKPLQGKRKRAKPVCQKSIKATNKRRFEPLELDACKRGFYKMKNIQRRSLSLKNRILKDIEEGKFQDLDPDTTLDKEMFLNIYEKIEVTSLLQRGLLRINQEKVSKSKIRDFLMYLLKRYHPKYEQTFEIEHLNTMEKKRAEFAARKQRREYLQAEFKCDKCFRPFEKKNLLEYHKQYHSESFRFPCAICSMRFPSLRRVYSHYVIHHKAVYRCRRCTLVTYSVCTMVSHYEWHAGVTFLCEFCSTVFNHKSSYDNHLRSCHTHTQSCEFCGRSFVSAVGVALHKKIKHQDECFDESRSVACSVCPLRFVSEAVVARHVRVTHQRRTPAARVVRAVRREERTRREGGHAANGPRESHDVPMVQQEVVYQCLTCDKICSTESQYASHLLEHAS